MMHQELQQLLSWNPGPDDDDDNNNDGGDAVSRNKNKNNNNNNTATPITSHGPPSDLSLVVASSQCRAAAALVLRIRRLASDWGPRALLLLLLLLLLCLCLFAGRVVVGEWVGGWVGAVA